MPTIIENIQLWNVKHSWPKDGDEWSETWGGAAPQWFSAILPRIHAFLPARTILELAPGHGRWTTFLKDHCERLIGVDLSAKCIEYCRARLGSDPRLVFHVNDGQSLAMIPDDSIDLVFSFDSLVHAEADVIKSYLQQLSKKLTAQGVGFIHHSNIGEYPTACAISNRLPARLRRYLVAKHLLDRLPQGRAPTMTARMFETFCDDAGLSCIAQEAVNWVQTTRTIDCFSLFAKSTSKWVRPNRFCRNQNFMREAESTRQLARLYLSSLR